jgi:myo-inositol-1(or 4)-monophosphatase
LTPWLETSRAAVEAVRRVLIDMPGRSEREPVVGRGEGGDDTVAVDRASETAIVEVLEQLHGRGESFTLVSEELGERRFGDDASVHVVLDPIDGSLNAKRGIPHFALSLAVADGPTLGDVFFGYVFDFGTGEEWTARRGEGAFLNGARLGIERPKDRIEILAFEATLTSLVAEKAAAMAPLAYRLRIMGSLAIALCNLAAGRIDGVCSLKPARSVDIAAGALLARECGLAVELFDTPPFDAAPLDVAGRSRIAAAGTRDLCAKIAEALSG